MRLAANQILLISAAGILAVGAGLAANIAGSAPKYQGPDPSSLQALAARLGDQPLTPAPELQGPARSVNLGSRIGAAGATKSNGSARIATKPAPRPLAPKPVRTPTSSALQPVAAAKDEAVKNIALTGVTDGAGQSLAWFVDISNNDRQTAEKGSAAFGFTVKEIHADSVLLTRGSDEFLVRMGDKQVPSVAVASFDPSEGGMPGGFGPGGFGPGGFGGGRGDRGGGSDFMQRIADFRSRFGGGSGGFGGGGFGGGGRSWGGGDSGGRSWGGGDSGRSNVSTTSNGGGRSWGGGGFGGGGFGGGGFGGGGFGGGGFSGGGFGNRGSRGQTTQTAVSTSNPQQARRSGGRLVGGATAMPMPDPISNPQTQRRTGTTSGQAFGDETANSGRNGFNNNSSRTSSYGNRGR
jgi:hypothetical protein